MVVEYGTLTVATGRVAGVISSGGLMVMERGWVTVLIGGLVDESDTENVNVPTVVGVPVMSPLGLMERTGGKVPLEMLQV
jgi:hypothetical protein